MEKKRCTLPPPWRLDGDLPASPRLVDDLNNLLLPMSVEPPPLPSSRQKLFVQLARVSWLSVIIAFGANIALQAGSGQAASRASGVLSAILIGSLALVGVIAGIVALFGVRRYGRKGLLWPAVTGICLWFLLFALALSVFLKVRQIALRKPTPLSPIVHLSAASRIKDATMGFSFDLPEGYESIPAEGRPEGYRHAFLRQVADQPNQFLLVKALGGMLPRQRLKPEEKPAGTSFSLTTFSWRGLEVDGFRVPEKIGDEDYVTFNVQIPLRKEAIQLGLGGPAELESQIRALTEQVLSTLDGETDW